jgi:hypothetical protein
MCESRNKVALSPSPREAGNGWVLDAVFPNGKQAAIEGFRTESEASTWLGSARHLTWLRDTRTTFCSRSAVAIFEWLGSCAIAMSNAAFAFCKSFRHSWCDIEALRVGYRRARTISAQLHAAAWRCVASDVTPHTRNRWAAGEPGSGFRHHTLYRCPLAVTVAFLILVAVLGALVAVLVALGHDERPARLGSGAAQLAADHPIASSHSSGVTDASDSIALLIDRMFSSEIATEVPSEAAGEGPSPQPTEDEKPAVDSHAATPRPGLRRAAPAIVGVWAPETGSCSARNTREGVLPAIISERGARAGETSCVFKEQRRTEGDFRVLANCTNGRERWTSNVRLIVKGDRLVWTSKRGTQAYTRCRANI